MFAQFIAHNQNVPSSDSLPVVSALHHKKRPKYQSAITASAFKCSYKPIMNVEKLVLIGLQ